MNDITLSSASQFWQLITAVIVLSAGFKMMDNEILFTVYLFALCYTVTVFNSNYYLSRTADYKTLWTYQLQTEGRKLVKRSNSLFDYQDEKLS